MIDGGMISGAITGTAIGTLTDLAIHKGHEKVKEALTGEREVSSTDLLYALIESVARLEMLAQRKNKPAWLAMQLYPGADTLYPATHFPYNMVFVKFSTDIILRVPGIGDVAATLYPGWNDLNMPPETMIALPQYVTSQVNLLFREAETSYSTLPQFSGQSQSGYISLVTTAPTQTNAANDTVLQFAEQVGTVTIQNNTGVTVFYAFDMLASPGGLQLTPGQSTTEAKKVTALHLYTSTQQNINGSTSGNIVVLGEM